LFFKNTLINQRKNCSLAGFQQAQFLPHILYHLSNLEAAGSPWVPIFQRSQKKANNRLFKQNTRNSAVNADPDQVYGGQKDPASSRMVSLHNSRKRSPDNREIFLSFFSFAKKIKKKFYNVVDFSGECLFMNKKTASPKKYFSLFSFQKKDADS
jgi:hypothetical protein